MVAIGILLVRVLGTVTMLSTASATTGRTRARVGAANNINGYGTTGLVRDRLA